MKFVGGSFQKTKTIFEELELLGVQVDKVRQFYPWFITFDFESILIKIDERPTEKLHWTEKHKPISVSICSNVPDFQDPVCKVNGDLNLLLAEMITYMTKIQEKAQALAQEHWRDVFEHLETLKQQWLQREHNLEREGGGQDSLDSELEDSQVEAVERKKIKHVKHFDAQKMMANNIAKVIGNFEHYCEQIPVLSFNGAKYDLNLIKSKLSKCLDLAEATRKFVVKKNNAYMCISNDRFKFLDITQYLAPGSSYSSFLSAFRVSEQKSFFPYQWFDSEEKLGHPSLPDYESFYSELKKENVLDSEHKRWDGKGEEPATGIQNYQNLLRIWHETGMTKFQDFLQYYNNLDVGPMVEAVMKLQQFYRNNNIDIFKISISVPGIARKMLFDSAQCHFSICGNEDQDLHYTIKQNIVGGPSIIFNRHHKSGETKLRQGSKLCQRILGYDANALYLWALGQEMPTGCFVRRHCDEGFKPVVNTKYLSMYFWLDYRAKIDGIHIVHKMNGGKEARIGPYLVDGFCAATNTVYEFNGCYYHGHDCTLTSHVNGEDRAEMKAALARTEKREQELKSWG
jgi:hypothetical protein